jgi:hypothetical protein
MRYEYLPSEQSFYWSLEKSCTEGTPVRLRPKILQVNLALYYVSNLLQFTKRNSHSDENPFWLTRDRMLGFHHLPESSG